MYEFFLGSPESCFDSDDDLPKKLFVITFFAGEWNQIKPIVLLYKLNDKNRPITKL